jgi:hypothetical protein
MPAGRRPASPPISATTPSPSVTGSATSSTGARTPCSRARPVPPPTATATATAVLTALIVVGLTAFVLVTDGFGLGLLIATLLAVVFQRLRLIGPCPQLLYARSVLLAVRAAWLLATTRRALVIAVFRLVRTRVSSAVKRLPFVRRHHAHHGCAATGPHVSCPSATRVK